MGGIWSRSRFRRFLMIFKDPPGDVHIKYGYIKNGIDEENKNDLQDIKILKLLLKEQKDILKNMYYEIHKKWLNIMESDYDEELFKQTFKLE